MVTSWLPQEVSLKLLKLHNVLQVANIGKLEQHYSALEEQAGATDFWDSQASAQATLQQMSNLKSSIDSVKGLQSLLSDVQTAIELAELEVRKIHHSLPILLACKVSLAHFL